VDQRGATVWLTGLPAAGKTTTGDAVAEALRERGYACYRLDGDVLRATISTDLGFDAASRAENVRRAAHLARILAAFYEVYLDTPLEVCERRDSRGLYAAARRGEATLVTGIDDPYEPPANPELVVHPALEPASRVATGILELVLASDLSGVLRVAASATA
jgi:adenylylsulfate kinase-like enzyme